MPKISGKNGLLFVNGSNFSTFADSYSVAPTNETKDVTGFGDSCHNFMAVNRNDSLTVGFFWDGTLSTGVNAKLSQLSTGLITIMPEGYADGCVALSLPYQQATYTPAGSPTDVLKLGTVDFKSYGNNYGVEMGAGIYNGVITATGSGNAVGLGTLGGSTRNVSGVLHIYTPTTTDTYVVTVAHATSAGGSYSTILTFTANGTAITAERQTASVALKNYVKVTCTRTGTAGDNFGCAVALYHS